jgi:hypothetical protein
VSETPTTMKLSIRNKTDGLENPALPSYVTDLLNIEENIYYIPFSLKSLSNLFIEGYQGSAS